VVWCGVVWCGVVWCGVVWCGDRTDDEELDVFIGGYLRNTMEFEDSGIPSRRQCFREAGRLLTCLKRSSMSCLTISFWMVSYGEYLLCLRE